jgi:hypothetical protein
MTADEIRIALETAGSVPEEAIHAAVRHAADLAPAVIAVAQSMADGRMPLPREERLLRFGLHALSVAREASVCPVFLALLRRPPLELEWLFSESDRTNRVARLLLGCSTATMRPCVLSRPIRRWMKTYVPDCWRRWRALRGRVARHARRWLSCSTGSTVRNWRRRQAGHGTAGTVRSCCSASPTGSSVCREHRMPDAWSRFLRARWTASTGLRASMPPRNSLTTRSASSVPR